MPRSARIDTPGSLYHVMIRGIERCKIFRNHCDYDDFIERLDRLIPYTSLLLNQFLVDRPITVIKPTSQHINARL